MPSTARSSASANGVAAATHFDAAVLRFFAAGAGQKEEVVARIEAIVDEASSFSSILERLRAHFTGYALCKNVTSIDNGAQVTLNPQPGELMDAVLQVSLYGSDKAASTERIKEFVAFLLEWYADADIYAKTEQLASEATSYIMGFISECAWEINQKQLSVFVATLLEGIINTVQSTSGLKLKVFDLLSLIVERMSSVSVEAPNVASLIDSAMMKLVSGSWPAENVLPLANVFKDTLLPCKHIEALINRFLKQLAHCAPDEISLLAFQIILMGKKLENGKKRRNLLLSIISHFDQNSVDLSVADSTINCVKEAATLMHIGIAIRQDNTIGTEFFSLAKTFSRAKLTPFTISLMLIMAKTKRFKEPLITLLKKEIDALLKLKAESSRLEWLNDSSPFQIPNIEKLLDSIVTRTNHNWEILDGLIELCFRMLDSTAGPGSHAFTPPSSLGQSSRSANYICGISVPNSILTSGEKSTAVSTNPMFRLGSSALLRLFEMHQMVRETILEAMLVRIAARSAGMLPVFEFLKLFVARSEILLPFMAKLNQMLDQVQHLPSTQAFMLLQSLLEISVWNLGFRDCVMLFLRKGTANKREDIRELSVRGIVELLAITRANSLPVSFLHEVLGLARRCTSLSAGLRLVFYHGIYRNLDLHPSLADFLLEFFTPHMLQYRVEKGLAISRCVHGYCSIVEPLPWLIKCCAKLVHHSSPGCVNRKTLSEELNKVAAEWEEFSSVDFEILPSASYGASTEDALHNYIRALVVLGSLEALCEVLLALFPDQSTESVVMERINTLDAMCHSISNNMRKQFVDSKGRKGPPSGPTLIDACVMSVEALCKVAPHIHSPRDQALLRKIHSTITRSNALSNASLDTHLRLAQMLFSALSGPSVSQIAQSDNKEKGKSIVHYAAETLQILLTNAMGQPWSQDFFDGVFPGEMSATDTIFEVFSTSVRYSYHKEATVLLKPLRRLVETSKFTDLRAAVLSFAKDCGQVSDPTLVKETLSLMVHLSPETDDLGVLVLLAKNILNEWGYLAAQKSGNPERPAVDEDALVLQDSDALGMLMSTPKNQLATFHILCEEIERLLGEIDWCLAEFKCEYGKKDNIPDNVVQMIPEFELCLCKRLHVVLSAVGILSKTAICSDAVEVFLRTLTRAFGSITALLQMKEAHLESPADQAFFDVVQTGSELHATVAYCQLEMDNSLPQSLRLTVRGGRKSNSAAARVERVTRVHAKLMAALVLQSEQFDVHVITLAKRYRQLGKYIKRSAVRDFRFESSKIVTAAKSVSKADEKKGKAPTTATRSKRSAGAPNTTPVKKRSKPT